MNQSDANFIDFLTPKVTCTLDYAENGWCICHEVHSILIDCVLTNPKLALDNYQVNFMCFRTLAQQFHDAIRIQLHTAALSCCLIYVGTVNKTHFRLGREYTVFDALVS